MKCEDVVYKQRVLWFLIRGFGMQTSRDADKCVCPSSQPTPKVVDSLLTHSYPTTPDFLAAHAYSAQAKFFQSTSRTFSATRRWREEAPEQLAPRPSDECHIREKIQMGRGPGLFPRIDIPGYIVSSTLNKASLQQYGGL
jgi:hypothetical protein